MSMFDGLESQLRAEADQRNPYVAPVYNEVINDKAVYEKSLLEGVGTFALQHSGVNTLKRVLKKSNMFSEEDSDALIESIGKGQGKEGLQKLASRLTGKGLKKLGSKVQDLADKAKNMARQAVGQEAEEAPQTAASDTAADTAGEIPNPAFDPLSVEPPPAPPAPTAPTAPDPVTEAPGGEAEDGLSDAVKSGLKKFGGDAEDVLKQGLSKAAEIDALSGGPEDIIGDVVAGVVGIGTLIGGLFRNTHHDSFVIPPLNRPGFEGQFVQKLG
jgi:hypothetical protein